MAFDFSTDPEFEKKGYRLPEIRTEIWQGWIYVTLNTEAPSVAEIEPGVAALAQIGGPYGDAAKRDEHLQHLEGFAMRLAVDVNRA
mgnify:CR=1 FL=1